MFWTGTRYHFFSSEMYSTKFNLVCEEILQGFLHSVRKNVAGLLMLAHDALSILQFLAEKSAAVLEQELLLPNEPSRAQKSSTSGLRTHGEASGFCFTAPVDGAACQRTLGPPRMFLFSKPDSTPIL